VAAGLALALGSRLSWTGAAASKPAWNSSMEFAISFTTFASTGGRYQRPYVAVWIEDASGTPVRTVSLWMLQSARGERYLDELRRWYNEAQSSGTLEGTLTGPTREAGRYTVVWDGRNDKKALVPQGDYYVCVESAREHGLYGLVRDKLTLGTAPQSKTQELHQRIARKRCLGGQNDSAFSEAVFPSLRRDGRSDL